MFTVKDPGFPRGRQLPGGGGGVNILDLFGVILPKT